MKRSFFLLPAALLGLSMAATAADFDRHPPIFPPHHPPTPPAERTDQLDTLGVEFLQLLNARNQQADLIGDKVKELLEIGNTIKSASVTYKPGWAGGIYRQFRIRTEQCGYFPSPDRDRPHYPGEPDGHHDFPVYRCFGGGELIITKTGAVLPGRTTANYTTELVRFR